MKKSVVVLVLLLFFVFGCTKFVGGDKKQQVVTNFRSGTEGLSMSFMPNMPPPKLFGNDKFFAMIRVENKGTDNILSPAMIYLSGFDKSIITGVTEYKDIPLLEGRSQYVSQGGFDMVSFEGTISQMSDFDKYSPVILATACYTYNTIASAQVCLDANPYSTSTAAKVCSPASVATGSQGAPIAVSSIDVQASPTKTRFTINIKNVGTGNVFNIGELQKCSPFDTVGLSYNELDFVEVADVSVSGNSIRDNCKPISKNMVRLVNGAATLFCETPTSGSAYLAPLTVYLKYGYRQTISTTVEIRPSV